MFDLLKSYFGANSVPMGRCIPVGKVKLKSGNPPPKFS